jgi:hypothetical protein
MIAYHRLVVSALLSSCLILVATGSLGAQEKPGNPTYDWLNGKWSGPAPLGGELQLELRIVDDDRVVGHSRVPRAGSKQPFTGNITGKVNGDRVDLEISSRAGTQKWRFRRKDQTLTSIRKGEEVVFKKMQ